MSKNQDVQTISKDVADIKRLLGVSYKSSCDDVTITPRVAEELLKFNTNNRPVNRRALKRYISSMEKGDFVKSTDTISFDKDGKLINGQHRLLACVQAGKPFESTVQFNGIQHLEVDRGVTRTPEDNILISGFISGVSKDAIRASKFILARLNGQQRVENDELKSLVEYNRDIIEKLDGLGVLKTQSQVWGVYRVYTPAALLSAAMCGVDLTTILHIKDVILTGIMSSPDDAILIKLRDNLGKKKVTTKKTNQDAAKYYMIQHCIYLYLNGKGTDDKKIKINRDKEYYTPIF